MERKQISTGTPWEASVGYSRAVRVGAFVYIAGTTAANENGQIHRPDDPYEQAAYTIRKIEAALQLVDARLEHVVRTRMYVTDMKDAPQVTKAHHEFFHAIRPASTIVEVSRLATDEMRVEIEVDAIVSD
jgi:enamine deaminase RidA (YjgF/YER057c/UK114 family)